MGWGLRRSALARRTICPLRRKNVLRSFSLSHELLSMGYQRAYPQPSASVSLVAPEKAYVPPYSVTNTIIHLLAEISEQVTDQVECLMSAIGSETLSAKELLERLGLKHRLTFSNNYLRPALELGLIEMTVPDKPNSSKQQYRAVKRNSD